jgi:hypothetical protein
MNPYTYTCLTVPDKEAYEALSPLNVAAEALVWGSENLDDEELRDGCAMLLGFFKDEE